MLSSPVWPVTRMTPLPAFWPLRLLSLSWWWWFWCKSQIMDVSLSWCDVINHCCSFYLFVINWAIRIIKVLFLYHIIYIIDKVGNTPGIALNNSETQKARGTRTILRICNRISIPSEEAKAPPVKWRIALEINKYIIEAINSRVRRKEDSGILLKFASSKVRA